MWTCVRVPSQKFESPAGLSDVKSEGRLWDSSCTFDLMTSGVSHSLWPLSFGKSWPSLFPLIFTTYSKSLSPCTIKSRSHINVSSIFFTNTQGRKRESFKQQKRKRMKGNILSCKVSSHRLHWFLEPRCKHLATCWDGESLCFLWFKVCCSKRCVSWKFYKLHFQNFTLRPLRTAAITS